MNIIVLIMTIIVLTMTTIVHVLTMTNIVLNNYTVQGGFADQYQERRGVPAGCREREHARAPPHVGHGAEGDVGHADGEGTKGRAGAMMMVGRACVGGGAAYAAATLRCI